MTITALPTPPSTSDPANFDSRADAFLGALPDFATETNAVAAAVDANAAQTAADRVQTGLDADATAADRVQTGLDAASAAASLDAFDDRYLGAKASDPTLDNDGNALLVGALYLNTVDDEIRKYNGSTWTRIVAVNPAGGNLTGAINEAKTTVASAATPDIWTGTGNLIDYTGTTTATGFAAAPQAGASRTLIAAAASSFTAGPNMLIDGWPTGTYKVAANDRIIVTALTTTMFLLQIIRADGGTVAQVGEMFDWPYASTPPYALVCDGSTFNAATYANLNARNGGNTLPNIPANYTTVQASGNEGTTTTGAVIAHAHSLQIANAAGSATTTFSRGNTENTGAFQSTQSAGGSANLAAGVRVRKCIRF